LSGQPPPLCKHTLKVYKSSHQSYYAQGGSCVTPMHGDGCSSIILNQDVLSENYVPVRLKAREAQGEQILCCLSPVTSRQKPVHIWLHGGAGTGKTTTAMHVFRRLDEKHSVKSIYINCFKYDTFYEILDAMISEFRILRADEHRTSFKLERLRSFLKDRPFIVVLDEVDQVKPRELSSVLAWWLAFGQAGLSSLPAPA